MFLDSVFLVFGSWQFGTKKLFESILWTSLTGELAAWANIWPSTICMGAWLSCVHTFSCNNRGGMVAGSREHWIHKGPRWIPWTDLVWLWRWWNGYRVTALLQRMYLSWTEQHWMFVQSNFAMPICYHELLYTFSQQYLICIICNIHPY